MNPVLASNLSALKNIQPAVAAAVADAKPSRLLRPITTRDGLRGLSMVTFGAEEDPEKYRDDEGNRATVEKALHSRYAPKREAARIVASAVPQTVETVVVFGLEAGFIARQVLERYQSTTVIVVERSWQVIRAALEWIDLSRELSGGRLHLVTSADSLVHLLDEVHMALLGDRTATITVTPWVESPENRRHFLACARALEEKIQGDHSDATTIRQFGQRWLVHTVRNSRRMNDRRGSTAATSRLETIVRGRPVTVLAAGPGLDRHLDQLSGGGMADTVFSVDTALPALLKRGIVPAAVAALDPQSWTAMHFRSDLPRGTVLLGDAGVSPQIIRDVPPEQLVWYFGKHPLHQLLYQAGAPLYMLPTPVESVTEAAVVIARGLGASSVVVHGADGGFPRGKTYARDTYHHSLATRTATRVAPAEQFFADRAYSGTIQYESTDGPFFSTPGMQTRTHKLDDLVTSREASPLRHPRRGNTFDPDHFWSDHLEKLQALSERLATCRSDVRTRGHAARTNELLRILGPHGIAHLPAIARFRCEKTPQADVDERSYRIDTALEAIRGFISRENCRYW